MSDGDWHFYCLMSLNRAVGIQSVLSRRENETNSRENFGSLTGTGRVRSAF